MSTQSDIALSSIIYLAVKPIFKIYMIIGVGFYLSRKNVLTVETSRNLSSIAILVFLPALVFAKIVTNIDNSDIKQIGTIAIECVFVIIIQGLLTFLVGVLAGCPKNFYGILISCGCFANISDIPIAYLQSMENSGFIPNVEKGVSYVCLFLCFQILAQFNLGGFKLVEFDFRNEINKKIQDPEAGVEHHINSEETKRSSDNLQVIEKHNRAVPSETESHSSNDELPLSVDGLHSVLSNSEAPMSILSSSEDEITQHVAPVNYQRNNIDGSCLSRRSSIISKIKSNQLSKIPSIANSLYDNKQKNAPPQNIRDIVKTYSRYDQLVEDQKYKLSENSSTANFQQRQQQQQQQQQQVNKFSLIRVLGCLKSFGVSMLEIIITSSLKPISISLVLSLIVCMIPWVKALFVETKQAHLSAAPDGEPPLSFMIDFASYIGNAQVPLGLLLLGGTIGRLQVKNLNRGGLWKVPVAMTIFKLCIFPVIGCAFNSKIHKDGLFYNDDTLYLVCCLNYALPPATSILYLTAVYIPPDDDDAFQMDLLALAYICHYILLVVSLPFTTTYTIKVALGY